MTDWRGAQGAGRVAHCIGLSLIVCLAPQEATASSVAYPQLASTTGRGPLELHECAAATTRCDGEIRVPLDWADPESERITVGFAWVPRSDTTRPATGTILANPGGPAAAIAAVPGLEQVLGPVLERRNLLVVEPRGFEASSPLRCPGLDLYDDASIAACAEALGPRVQYFASDQIVADMDAARAALGVQKVSFYGNSYGSVFAHGYATRFPDHTEAVFFDSVVRIGDDGYVSEPIHSRMDDIELVCQRSPTCDALSGTPTSRMERVIDLLRAKPDPEVPVGALRTLRQGANLVGAREGSAAIAAYLAGDRGPLRRLTRTFRPGRPFEMKAPDLAAVLAIRCGDSRFPFDRKATPVERGRQLARFFSLERPLAPFRVDDIPGYRPTPEQCLHWPTPRESPPVPAGSTHPSVPVLAVAGDFDTQSPTEVERLIARFPRSTVETVRYGTHALARGARSSYGPCVRKLMRAFLANPRHPGPPGRPGFTGCDGETFRAVGSFPRSQADVPAALTDDLPAPDRRLVAAVFATVADAVARRNPNDAVFRPATEPGLRGGEVRWDREANVTTLEEVRFVADVAVSGTVGLDDAHWTTAELRAIAMDGRSRELTLRWRAFVAENQTEVQGTLDGRAFVGRIPIH